MRIGPNINAEEELVVDDVNHQLCIIKFFLANLKYGKHYKSSFKNRILM